MNRKIIWIVFLFVTLSLLHSCGKCRTKDTGDYYFSSSDLSILPYSGNEILVYKNSAGDSIRLTGVNRYSKMEQGYTSQEGEMDCPETTFKYETNTTNFNGNDGNYIWFKLTKNIAIKNSFHFYFIIKSPISFEEGVSIGFESGKLFDYYGALMTPDDTLSINNIVFHSVYKLTKNDEILYYTLTDGIVGFKTADNVEWSLE